MPTYNLVAHQLPFGWLDSNGSNFTYSSGTMPSDVLSITENDGTADDWFDDYSPSSNSGDSATQIAQADVFGFSIDGLAIQTAARMRLSGSDGSTIELYVVTTDNGVAGLEDDDNIFVTDGPLLDGVTYTKISLGLSFGSDGEVLYADLVQVPPPDGYVDGTAGDDVIDVTYVGDPDGDMVDDNDAILPGDTGDDDNIRAGDGNDTVFAGAGDDTVDGGDGDDLIEGGAGADAIDGGGGSDTATYANSASAVDVSLLDGTGSGGDAAGDTLTNVENLIGSDYDDTLQGDFGDNQIDGGTGADTIIGGAGDDTITGGDDDDVIYGDHDPNVATPDQVTFFVDGYFKDADFHLTAGHFSNSANTVFVMDSGLSRIRFVDTGDGDLDIDAPNEVINVAESGLVEVDGEMYRYAADFTITYDGSDGNTYEFIVIDVDLDGDGTNNSYTVGSDTAFEDGQILLPVGPPPAVGITLTSPGAGIGVAILPNTLDYTTLAGYGLTYDDTIDGGDGDDTIYGGLGDDTIDGGDGDDTIDGGVGNDDINGGIGADIISGGDGDDTISGFAGQDTIDGGDGADTIAGGNGGDIIDGGAGNDVVFGQAGNDTITGGSGNDALSGGGGSDTISGGLGHDNIVGGGGDDTLSGGTGSDDLEGGAGDDEFVYGAGDGADTIIDFGTGESGPTNDGDQTNNDFVDLSNFYNATTLDAVNNADVDPGNDFNNALAMMRADQADGVLDGAIGGIDYSSQIGDIDLTIESGGSAVAGNTLTFDNTNVVCFARGTRISTQGGETPIEDLTTGDLVMTLDHGYQPIRWIGSTTVQAKGKLAPIQIRKGALGNNRDLLVSPNHRILLCGWQAEMLFGKREVLAAAKHLINDTSISRLEGGKVDYFHLLFDTHELVFSEGLRSESFHPGQQGWGALSDEARTEILQLFPDLADRDFKAYGPTVRNTLKAREAMLAREVGGFISENVGPPH